MEAEVSLKNFMLFFQRDKQTNKQTHSETKQDTQLYTCTFLIGSRLTPSVGVDCPGSLKPCGVGFSSGELEHSSLYRSCLVAGALVPAALARVGFGCANNPCPVD